MRGGALRAEVQSDAADSEADEGETTYGLEKSCRVSGPQFDFPSHMYLFGSLKSIVPPQRSRLSVHVEV